MRVLDELGVTALVDELLDQGKSPMQVANALADKGFAVSSGTVREHARSRDFVAKVVGRPATAESPATTITTLERDDEPLISVSAPLVSTGLSAVELVGEVWDKLAAILQNQLLLVEREQARAAADQPSDVKGMVRALTAVQDMTKRLRPWLEGEVAAYGCRVELPEPRTVADLKRNLDAINHAVASGLIPAGQGRLLLEIVGRQERVLVLEQLAGQLAQLEGELRGGPPLLEGVVEDGELAA